MAISGIGSGMTSADLVAYLALQSSEDDKKTHDAARHADEQVQHSEERKEISSMQDQALDTLVTGVGTAAIQAGACAAGAVDVKWSPAARDNVAMGFHAAETAFKGVGDAMGQFAAKDSAEHRIKADRAKSDADDCKSAATHAQQSADQAIEAARSIRAAEDQVRLEASKRA